MNVFEFRDYRTIVQKCAREVTGPRGGLARLSRSINLHTTTLSQILKGTKPMSAEHAILTCQYFGFSQLETRYFLLLIQLDRAGNQQLREEIIQQIEELRADSQQLQKIIPSEKEMKTEDKAIFYSHWLFSAIRVLSSLPHLHSAEKLAQHLGVSRPDLNNKLKFLLKVGLCRDENAKIQPGPKYTHLDSRSPYIAHHHANWRIKAIERHPSITDNELSYTAPMSLSEGDAAVIRSKLIALVKEINSIRDPSPCETTFFLNVDWLRF